MGTTNLRKRKYKKTTTSPDTGQQLKITNKRVQQITLHAPKKEDNPKPKKKTKPKLTTENNTQNLKITDLFKKQITSNSMITEITPTQKTNQNNAETDNVHQDLESTSDSTVQSIDGAVQRAEVDELDSLDSTLSENPKNSQDISTLPDLVKNKNTFTFKQWLVIKPETK